MKPGWTAVLVNGGGGLRGGGRLDPFKKLKLKLEPREGGGRKGWFHANGQGSGRSGHKRRKE